MLSPQGRRCLWPISNGVAPLFSAILAFAFAVRERETTMVGGHTCVAERPLLCAQARSFVVKLTRCFPAVCVQPKETTDIRDFMKKSRQKDAKCKILVSCWRGRKSDDTHALVLGAL